MRKEESIQITTPQPFEVVGAKFDLVGKVPKSWLSYGKYGLGVDWLEANGGHMMSSGPNVNVLPSIFPWSRKVRFLAPVDLSYFDPCEHPRGLILVVETYEIRRSYYLPVIFSGTNKAFDSEREMLKQKLSDSISRITKQKEDLENYTKELNQIRRSVLEKKEILEGVFEILEQSDDGFESFTQSAEEKLEEELEKKYKDALAARGPLFRGVAGRMDGFAMHVYSDDHGRHFHVTHKGKGINVRFSFPDMERLSYVSPAIIGSKTEKKIQAFCRRPEIFSNLEAEFAKRIQVS